MKIKERKFKGVFEIMLAPHLDERGFFMRTYDDKIFAEYSINREWVQENHSRSGKKGIIRGLHFQFPPFSETKLIRAVKGVVLDVFVDLRKGSPTFGLWDSITLSEDNNKCIFIPRGFAHGFCTLTESCDILYKHNNYYNPEFETGILWNDRHIGIEWPTRQPILSSRDRGFQTLKEFVNKHKGIEV